MIAVFDGMIFARSEPSCKLRIRRHLSRTAPIW